MAKHELIVVVDTSQDSPLTLDEVCATCQLPADFIHDLIDYEIIHPRGQQPQDWQFGMTELQRIQRAKRLHHDLEVNLAGIALALDLMEELEELRAQMKLWQKHYW